jgi:hypothetical protein
MFVIMKNIMKRPVYVGKLNEQNRSQNKTTWLLFPYTSTAIYSIKDLRLSLCVAKWQIVGGQT